MCGLFGVFNPPGCKADLPACKKATDLQSHRGPDAYGEWVSASGDVFLGHRRLSIIDLSDNASQPMISRSGDILIYNGEIYNFQELRNELKSEGYIFKSTSDTEVLLNALDTWGIECLNRLEGMFAFVLWSPATQEAIIVRDFFGIKPLYYWRPPQGGLVVSSEIKSFYALDAFHPEINTEELPEYLRFRSLCSDKTLLRGVSKVLPGQWLRYDRRNDELKPYTYWEPFSFIADQMSYSNFAVNESQFLEEFAATVTRHLIADVPVGAQFSGGIDSSLISSICTKDLDAQLTGFYCQVEDPEFDETAFAEEISAYLGMMLRKAFLHGSDLLSDQLDKLTWHHDEPLVHPNSVGIYLISQIAHGDVKVLLSGECADEFFGGYSHYLLLRIHDHLQQWPMMGRLLNFTGQLFSGSTRLLRALQKLTNKDRPFTTDQAIATATEFGDEVVVTQLLGDPKTGDKSIASRLLMLPKADNLNTITRSQLFDVRSYIPTLLMRQDKMSMAASIENRVPFAVPEILRLAMQVPLFGRVGFMSRKGFLKSCLKQYLPKKYVHRRKWGFGLPMKAWLTSPNGLERLENLTSNNSSIIDLVDKNHMQRLAKDFSNGSNQNTDILWTLVSLQVWTDIFCKARGKY